MMWIKAIIPFTLRDATTGALTSIGGGQRAQVDDTLGAQLISDGLAEAYTETTPTGQIEITSNGIKDVSVYATASVSVDMGLKTVVAPVDDDVDLLGKDAGDLQEDIAISNGAVTGTLKYVTGYTGFSGDVAEQSGNYIGLLVTAVEGATITVELKNGTVGHPVTLDSDGMIVIRITDTDTQSIEIVSTLNNLTETIELDISGLTLASA